MSTNLPWCMQSTQHSQQGMYQRARERTSTTGGTARTQLWSAAALSRVSRAPGGGSTVLIGKDTQREKSEHKGAPPSPGPIPRGTSFLNGQ